MATYQIETEDGVYEVETDEGVQAPTAPVDQGSAWDAIPTLSEIGMAPVNMIKGLAKVPSAVGNALTGTADFIMGEDAAGAPVDRTDILRNGLRNTRDIAASMTMIPGAVTASRSLSEDNYTPQQARQDLRGELAAAPLNAALVGGSNLLKKIPENVSEGALNKMVGYNPELKQGAPVALDAEGLATRSPESAVAQVSKKDLKIKDLVDGGYPETVKISDGPATASLKLWQFKENAGQQIGNIIDNSLAVEQQFLSSAAPWEANQYLLKNSPSFSSAQEYLDGILATSPDEAAALQTRFDAIKNAWEASDQSLSTFKQLQENLGLSRQSSFNPTSAKESFNNTLNNLMYGDIAQSLEGRVATLGQLQGMPQLGQQFAKANKSFSAAATFQNDAFNASRQSIRTKLGSEPLKTIGQGVVTAGASLAQNSFPVQTMKAADAVTALMDLSSRPPVANPLILSGEAIIPRNWKEVKENPKSKADLAFKLGMPTGQFDTLPEPLQQQLHAQIVMSDPLHASATPGNYNIVNGRFMNPAEKDFFMREAMDLSAAERAKRVIPAFENKYAFSPQEEMAPQPVTLSPQIDLGSINSSLDSAFSAPSNYDSSADKGTTTMLDQLNQAIAIHDRDVQTVH